MIYINNRALHFLVSIFISTICFAQVGIGTIKPEGMLDLQNNNSAGFIFPNVVLTATNIEAPVINPNGGGLVTGTAVFNTNTTNSGTNDVYPGIYAWDGSKWIPQYLREDSEIYEQSTLELRVKESDSYVDVTGLGSGSSFTPKYSGDYRIKANFNFGAGEIIDNQVIDIATQEGYFRFTFNGSPYLIYTHAYSIHNDNIGSGVLYEKFRHDSSMVLYETLIAGTPYSFSLEIDMFVSSDFVDNGDSGTGRSWVGIEIPCSIEFTYLEE